MFHFIATIKGNGQPNRYELLDMREEISNYESGNTEKINESLYKTLKSELENVESVVGAPLTEKREEKQESNNE